jgi:hypothetical protein
LEDRKAGYQVRLPGAGAAENPFQGAAGLIYQVRKVTRDQGKVIFQVGSGDLTAGQVEKGFPANWFKETLVALQRALPGSTAKGGKDLNLQGNIGKEWTIQSPTQGNLVVRLYGVKRGTSYRLFLLTAQGPQYAADHADVAEFFNSFRLLSPKEK